MLPDVAIMDGQRGFLGLFLSSNLPIRAAECYCRSLRTCLLPPVGDRWSAFSAVLVGMGEVHRLK